jgi:hypothetical protein
MRNRRASPPSEALSAQRSKNRERQLRRATTAQKAIRIVPVDPLANRHEGVLERETEALVLPDPVTLELNGLG